VGAVAVPDEVDLLDVRVAGQDLSILIHEPADVPLPVGVEQEREHREVTVRRFDDLDPGRATEPIRPGVSLLQRHFKLIDPLAYVTYAVKHKDNLLDLRVLADWHRRVRLPQLVQLTRLDRLAEFHFALAAIRRVAEVKDRDVVGSADRYEDKVLGDGHVLVVLVADHVVDCPQELDDRRPMSALRLTLPGRADPLNTEVGHERLAPLTAPKQACPAGQPIEDLSELEVEELDSAHFLRRRVEATIRPGHEDESVDPLDGSVVGAHHLGVDCVAQFHGDLEGVCVRGNGKWVVDQHQVGVGPSRADDLSGVVEDPRAASAAVDQHEQLLAPAALEVDLDQAGLSWVTGAELRIQDDAKPHEHESEDRPCKCSHKTATPFNL